ncbi:hypothetical protein TNCV_80411 [Trichonephila clavipes]|nr:hypothetical protein TNCV_80411 [Trichonephila clavipes]
MQAIIHLSIDSKSWWISSTAIACDTHFNSRPTQYSGYDTRLVIKWVRIPRKAWMYLWEKEIGLSPEMDSRLAKGKAAYLFCSLLGSSFVIKSVFFCDCVLCFCSSISRLSYVSQ